MQIADRRGIDTHDERFERSPRVFGGTFYFSRASNQVRSAFADWSILRGDESGRRRRDSATRPGTLRFAGRASPRGGNPSGRRKERSVENA
jgi:hypothetical protein